MSNIFHRIPCNCKAEAKFGKNSPFKYGIKAIGKKVIMADPTEKQADAFDSNNDGQVTDTEFKETVNSSSKYMKEEGALQKRGCKKKSRLEGESDLDYNRRVHGVNRGSRPSNYQGPVTEQVGKTVKGSVQKLV